MKCYIVSSRLFASGQIMAPFRLQRERDAAIAKKVKLEQELARLPATIANLDAQANALLAEFNQLPIKRVL